jgi:predicted Co/Zn/Cd cation transporter (cation efflux family)
MKKELMVRFANESIYYTRITVSLDKIKDALEFPNEVFFTIDDTRVAVKIEDWEEIKNEINKKKCY